MTNFRVTKDGTWVRVPLDNIMFYTPPSGTMAKMGLLRRRGASYSPGRYDYRKEVVDWLTERDSQVYVQMNGNSEFVDVLFAPDKHDIALMFKLTWGGE